MDAANVCFKNDILTQLIRKWADPGEGREKTKPFFLIRMHDYDVGFNDKWLGKSV